MNKNRYKSSVNKVYYVFLIIYNIITLLLLTSKIFVTTNIALLGGLLFLVFDIFILLPHGMFIKLEMLTCLILRMDLIKPQDVVR